LAEIAVLEKMQRRVYVMLLASEYDDYTTVFSKFLKAISHHLPKGIHIQSKSNSRKQALLDTQVYFPDIFKVSL